jgi:hypothetical protein
MRKADRREWFDEDLDVYMLATDRNETSPKRRMRRTNRSCRSYPTAAAFLEMVTDPVYRQAVVHRQAAVATSRLIRCAPRDAGEGFA